MRFALWLVALFAVAVAIALFAGNNQGTITVFWPPYRVDLSLNLVLLALILTYTVLYVAMRALSALFNMPQQARRWRVSQREHAMVEALLAAVAQGLAGRYLRARKSAQALLAQESALEASGERWGAQVSAVAHWLEAEAAHLLQDRAGRDRSLDMALAQATGGTGAVLREGIQIRAASWALKDHDAARALQLLSDMPQGAARRTVALRIRLRAARLGGRTLEALETARLLAKHKAFSESGARSIVRSLAQELIAATHDASQLERAWRQLEASEQQLPDIAVEAAHRLLDLDGAAAQARAWLLPVWSTFIQHPKGLPDAQRLALVQVIERSLVAPDADWLARIEAAHHQHAAEAPLQYLSGMACMKAQLWGKAQQLLSQSMPGLHEPALRRNGWRALAQLAEQRGDKEAALQAWKQAAQA